MTSTGVTSEWAAWKNSSTVMSISSTVMSVEARRTGGSVAPTARATRST